MNCLFTLFSVARIFLVKIPTSAIKNPHQIFPQKSPHFPKFSPLFFKNPHGFRKNPHVLEISSKIFIIFWKNVHFLSKCQKHTFNFNPHLKKSIPTWPLKIPTMGKNPKNWKHWWFPKLLSSHQSRIAIKLDDNFGNHSTSNLWRNSLSFNLQVQVLNVKILQFWLRIASDFVDFFPLCTPMTLMIDVTK